ncbi:MAG TPA: hypothetical protein DC054_17920 [Blastocatellia bacterium]|nr:hypothetical protein [Blastocatellia bacterium]
MLSNEMESCGCDSLSIRYAAFSSICYRGYPSAAFIVKPIAFEIRAGWFGQSLTVARDALYHRHAQSTATLFTCKSTLSAETGGHVRD